MLDSASKGILEDEFGTSKEDDVVRMILERGEVQETEVRSLFLLPCLLCLGHKTRPWIFDKRILGKR